MAFKKPISLKGLKTSSIKKRKSKVSTKDMATLYKKGAGFNEFLKSLPSILAADDLKAVALAIVKAHGEGRSVAIGMGAHVIKTGLSPLIIDLMERGVITSVAMNGAGIVHDFELAFNGTTSEDVDSEIGSGTFGMAEETGRMLNKAIKKGADKNLGLGRSVGEMIEGGGKNFPHKDLSILAAGVRCKVPVTVHVAIGTDIIHMHPAVDGSATGKASHIDFRIMSTVVSELEGGVFLNIGSAVIVPEVFLKALTLVRNKGFKVEKFTAVNMDFLQQYRPITNVVRRPTSKGGKGYALTGHHEIMVPLLYAAIIEGF